MTRAQLATVERTVATCTTASVKLTPLLRRGDRASLANAAIDARNTCSSARADLVAAVGIGGPLAACYFSVDRQEAVQQSELDVLDAPTPDNRRRLVAGLDEAIRQQTACGAAIAAERR